MAGAHETNICNSWVMLNLKERLFGTCFQKLKYGYPVTKMGVVFDVQLSIAFITLAIIVFFSWSFECFQKYFS